MKMLLLTNLLFLGMIVYKNITSQTDFKSLPVGFPSYWRETLPGVIRGAVENKNLKPITSKQKP